MQAVLYKIPFVSPLTLSPTSKRQKPLTYYTVYCDAIIITMSSFTRNRSNSYFNKECFQQSMEWSQTPNNILPNAKRCKTHWFPTMVLLIG